MGRAYFKARGVKKDSISDMIDSEVTNIPVKSGIILITINLININCSNATLFSDLMKFSLG